MSRSPGTRSSAYEVTAKTGDSSMGEVCEAWNTDLDRNVALKVSHRRSTSDIASLVHE